MPSHTYFEEETCEIDSLLRILKVPEPIEFLKRKKGMQKTPTNDCMMW